jgi:hypothetical protein
MDSVVVFFGSASPEEVEQEASKHGLVDGTVTKEAEHFYFSRYSETSARAELGASEQSKLRNLLGTEFKSAFQVASRHGPNARFALQVVSSLMSKFQPSVLDDDFGNLWLPAHVDACAATFPKEGIYALRPDASNPLQGLPDMSTPQFVFSLKAAFRLH